MSYQQNLDIINQTCNGNTILIEECKHRKQRDPDEEYEKERDDR